MKNTRSQTTGLLILVFLLQSIIPAHAGITPPQTVDPAMSSTTSVQALDETPMPLSSPSTVSAAEQFEDASPLSSFTPPQPVSTISTAIQTSAFNSNNLSKLPSEPSLGYGPYASGKISQSQNSSGSYNFNYNLTQPGDYAYSIINVRGNLGSTFTIGLQGPAGKQLKIELYDGYNHLSYYANLTGTLQNYTITIPADSDTFHSNQIFQIALVVEQEKSGSYGAVEVRTQGLLNRASTTADSTLNARDISTLADLRHWTTIHDSLTTAELSQDSNGIHRLTYQPHGSGWAAAFSSFDDFSTESVESKNIESLGEIVVGLTSDITTNIKLEIEDINGQKALIYLDNVFAAEKLYRITINQIQLSNAQLDLSKIKGILFVTEFNGNQQTGNLQIRLNLDFAPPPVPVGWTRTETNSNFAYIIEKTVSSSYNVFKARVRDLRSGQEYSFNGKYYAANTATAAQFSVDVAGSAVYAKLSAPKQVSESNETYLILASGVTAYQLAPSNPQFAFGFRQNGIGYDYIVNLKTGEVQDIAQSSRYVQNTMVDVSPNGKYVLWRSYYNPYANYTSLTEIGGNQNTFLAVNGAFYSHQFFNDGKLLITYDAQTTPTPDYNYSAIKQTIELDTNATFDQLQKRVVYEAYYSKTNQLIKTVKYAYGLTKTLNSPYKQVEPYNLVTTTLYHTNGKAKEILAQQIYPNTLKAFNFDKKVYDSYGVILSWAMGSYYADGKTISAQLVTTYSKGKLISRYAYYYNSKGVLIKKIRV